jgi:hypothetical protein
MATGRYKLVRRKRPSNKPLEREPVELEEWQEPRPVRGRGRGRASEQVQARELARRGRRHRNRQYSERFRGGRNK